MGQADLREVISGIAEGVTGRRPRSPEAPLGLDSLGGIEFGLALEERFGVAIPDHAVPGSVVEAAALVATLRSRARGRRPPLPTSLGRSQAAVVRTVRGPLQRMFKLEVMDASRVPFTGPAVVAVNHESMWDVPLLVVATLRPVWFMAKEELFRKGITARAFTRLGGFSVRRGIPDLGAARGALAVLRSGRVLGMFPEGTRSPGTLRPFLGGAAWASLATGAPLVPVGLAGTDRITRPGLGLPRRVPVRISFGEPIEVERVDDPPTRLERAAKLSARVRAEVERLLAD